MCATPAAWGQAGFYFFKYLPADGPVNGQMQVTFEITGIHEIASVAVDLDGLSAPLVYSSRGIVKDPTGAQGGPYFTPAWTNSLNTMELSKGSHTLRVAATDTLGNHGAYETTVNVDQLPKISITPSFSGRFYGTNLQTTVTVSDDGAIPHLQFTLTGYKTITNDTGHVEVNVPLKETGQLILAHADVTDDGGQKVTLERLYLGGPLNAPSDVWPYVEVYSGEMVDTREGQVLYSMVNEEFQGYVIKELEGFRETRIPATNVRAARLVSGGVLFVTGTQSVYFAHHGTNELVGSCQPAQSVIVAGDWAIWANGAETYARHFPDGTSAIITPEGYPVTGQRALASNGLVVVAKPAPSPGIYQWREGVSTPVVVSSDPSFTRENPVTDGQRIAYKLIHPGDQTKIALYENGRETIVGDLRGGGVPYAISDNRFIWMASRTSGVYQILGQVPGGTPEPLVASGARGITWVGPGGWLIYNVSQFSRPNLPVLDLGSTGPAYVFSNYQYFRWNEHLYLFGVGRGQMGSIKFGLSAIGRFDPRPTVKAWGGGTLGINAPIHSTARLERSVDLRQWAPVADVTLTNEAGIFHVDTDQTGFFRAVVDP